MSGCESTWRSEVNNQQELVLFPHGFQELDSGHQAWWQVLLPSEHLWFREGEVIISEALGSMDSICTGTGRYGHYLLVQSVRF